jgi:demethylmenaquinone methyltransferase / 2-methoxy-6-polyprenyl-1,4-benzoquinol methylase
MYVTTLKLHDGYKSARRFFNHDNAANYDYIVRFATFGQDYIWKNQIVKRIGKRCLVLDLACGTGILSSMIMDKVTTTRVIGIDLEFNYLQMAKNKRKDLLLTNGTAEMLPYKDECFDSITSSYLAKYVDVKIMVDECWRILRHNGIIVFHDFTYPTNNLFQKLWNTYFMILKITGYSLKSWLTVFKELDTLVQTSDWVEHTIESLNQRGFKNVFCKYYTFGTAAIISAIKP